MKQAMAGPPKAGPATSKMICGKTCSGCSIERRQQQLLPWPRPAEISRITGRSSRQRRQFRPRDHPFGETKLLRRSRTPAPHRPRGGAAARTARLWVEGAPARGGQALARGPPRARGGVQARFVEAGGLRFGATRAHFVVVERRRPAGTAPSGETPAPSGQGARQPHAHQPRIHQLRSRRTPAWPTARRPGLGSNRGLMHRLMRR